MGSYSINRAAGASIAPAGDAITAVKASEEPPLLQGAEPICI
jgi:hypothetical protein